jgi:hypothetical protein
VLVPALLALQVQANVDVNQQKQHADRIWNQLSLIPSAVKVAYILTDCLHDFEHPSPTTRPIDRSAVCHIMTSVRRNMEIISARQIYKRFWFTKKAGGKQRIGFHD